MGKLGLAIALAASAAYAPAGDPGSAIAVSLLNYDAGFDHGTVAACNAIIMWLTRTGQADLAASLKTAWESNTLVEPEPTAMPSITIEQARFNGYTGDSCSNCQGLRMKVAGHCTVCEDCGTTTGCS